MDDESAVEEIISKFIINTYRLRPQLSQAALHCATLVSSRLVEDAEANVISTVETYIEPVGDVDVMFHRSD